MRESKWGKWKSILYIVRKKADGLVINFPWNEFSLTCFYSAAYNIFYKSKIPWLWLEIIDNYKNVITKFSFLLYFFFSFSSKIKYVYVYRKMFKFSHFNHLITIRDVIIKTHFHGYCTSHLYHHILYRSFSYLSKKTKKIYIRKKKPITFGYILLVC